MISDRLEENSAQNSANAPAMDVPATALGFGIGFLVRSLLTAAPGIEDTLSLMDLTADFFTENIYAMAGISVPLALGSAYVTWAYWSAPAQELVSEGIDGCVAKRHNANRYHKAPECSPRCQPGQSIPWLIFVSVASSAATFALTANENEEGMRMYYGLANSTPATIGVSLGLGGVATLYSVVTELRYIWLVRLYGEDNINEGTAKCSILRHVFAIAGPLELAFRTWLVIYLSSMALVGNAPLANIAATVISGLGTIQNFLFQGLSAIDPQWVEQIERFLFKLPLFTKISFLILSGLISVAVNLGLSGFNISTLLMSICNGILGWDLSTEAIIGISLSIASMSALGDLMSSFWVGTVRPMMGWDQDQPPVLIVPQSASPRRNLLEGSSQLYIRSPYRFGFSSVASSRLRVGPSDDFELNERTPLDTNRLGLPKIQ